VQVQIELLKSDSDIEVKGPVIGPASDAVDDHHHIAGRIGHDFQKIGRRHISDRIAAINDVKEIINP